MCGKYSGCLFLSTLAIAFLVLAWISFSTSHSHVHTEYLPRIPPYFTGREAEVNLLMKYVQNDVSVISITGGPGYGKSSLAIVSIHRLLEANFPVVVNHVSLRGIDSIDDFTTTFLHSVSNDPTSTSTSKREQLLSWAKKVNDKHIVILDNADELTLKASAVRDNFMLLLKEFIDSTSLVQFLVTTQYRCQYPVNFEEIHLSPINASSTVNLLQKLMFSGNDHSDLSEQEVHQLGLIANLTDGIPLAGKVVGLLLKSGALCLSEVVEGLSSHPMHTLSRESFSAEERLNHCFNLSYTYLPPIQKQCFVYASRFPGSFNHKARDAIITKLTADKHCLEQLIDRSLVEYNVAVKRYSVHSLLQHFATESLRGRFRLQEFNKLFVEHFITDLRRLIKQSRLSGNVTDLSYFIVEDHLNYLQSFKYMSRIQSVLTPIDLLSFVDESFLVIESRFPGDVLLNMWEITLNDSCSNDAVSLSLDCPRSMAPNFLRFSVNFANLFRFSNNSISQARDILHFADGCIERKNNFVVHAKTHAMVMHLKPLCNAKHRLDYMTFLYAKRDIAVRIGNESEAEAISSILEACTSLRMDYKLPHDPIDFMDDEQKCVDGVKYLRNSVHEMLAKSRTEFKFCYVVQFVRLVNRCSDLATARAEVYELQQLIYGSRKELDSSESDSLRYCTEGFPICRLFSFLQDNYSEVECLLQGIKKINDNKLVTLCSSNYNRFKIQFLFFLHFRLTNLYFTFLNDYTAAKEHAKIAYDISKKMAIVAVKHEFLFKAAFRLADILYASGDLKGAVLLYQEALDHLPFVTKDFVNDSDRFHWRLDIEQNVLDILIETKQFNLAFQHYGQWAKTGVQDVASKFVHTVKELYHGPIFIVSTASRGSSVAIKDHSFHPSQGLPVTLPNFKLFSSSTIWYYAEWFLDFLIVLFPVIIYGLLGPLLFTCLCLKICFRSIYSETRFCHIASVSSGQVHPGVLLQGVIYIIFSFHYFLYNAIVKGIVQMPKTFTVPHKLMENPTSIRCVSLLNFLFTLPFVYCASLFLFIVSINIGIITSIYESNPNHLKLSMTIFDTEYSKYICLVN